MALICGKIIQEEEDVCLNTMGEQKLDGETREVRKQATPHGIDGCSGNIKHCLVTGRSGTQMTRKAAEQGGNIQARTDYVSG